MAKLLSNLNLNDRVRFGKHQVNNETPESVVWRIVACNHNCTPAYPANSVTLWTDKVIDRRSVDAYEPDNPVALRKTRGNNRYIHSNLFLWLNSSASEGKWYSPQHEYDSPPDTAASCYNNDTFYFQRAGFLHNFTEKERDIILPTTFRVTKSIDADGGGYDDSVAKIFLPSKTELGFPNENGISEGALWPAITDTNSIVACETEQCYNNTMASVKPLTVDSADTFFLRTGVSVNVVTLGSVSQIGALTATQAYVTNGIRPALNLSGDTLVSDEVDADGCYNVILNDSPAITAVPSGNLGVQSTPLKQTYTVTDPDGDGLSVIEKLNGEVIRTLTDQSSGTKLTLDLTSQWQTLNIDTPHTAIIEVTDGIFTMTHEWTFTRSNTIPTITAKASGNLGKLAVPFKQEYTITDTNADTLTVAETLDGQVINTLLAQPSGVKLTFDLADRWASLSKDTLHTAIIEVTDGLLTATHTWTFHVIDPIQQQITAQSAVQPTSVVIPILPVEVLVTNNANDPDPVWEDASDAYLKRKRYSFENNTKTADEWCVAVKYTVNGVTIPVKLTTIHEYKFS